MSTCTLYYMSLHRKQALDSKTHCTCSLAIFDALIIYIRMHMYPYLCNPEHYGAKREQTQPVLSDTWNTRRTTTVHHSSMHSLFAPATKLASLPFAYTVQYSSSISLYIHTCTYILTYMYICIDAHLLHMSEHRCRWTLQTWTSQTWTIQT
jgi:hypothetical protein